MKKIISFILLLCMVLASAACADTGSKMPEITLQEVYEAGKDYAALMGDHESMHILITSNGNALMEDYLAKDYSYSVGFAEYTGFNYAIFLTGHIYHNYADNTYLSTVILAPDGIIDMKEYFVLEGEKTIISLEMANHDDASIIEKDGAIIVTCIADMNEIAAMGEEFVSCEEIYTLDAKTREMTSVRAVCTYEDGTVVELIATITRDVEMPEGLNPFLAYEQETENLRTITIVSNPGTENEKADSIKIPKGMHVACVPDTRITDKFFAMYSDAACTQLIEENGDPNSDVTIYIKWDE